MFDSIFQNNAVTPAGILLMLAAALGCGIAFAVLACFGTKTSRSFFLAVSLLPMTVAMVIALVNGNLGVGVAIAGAFGLVRFRSAQGSAKEIAVIFIGMASGLAFGTGYVAYGALFLLLCGTLVFAGERIPVPNQLQKNDEKIIRISIPETLDYTTVFDDVFRAYTKRCTLEQVKSTNMGSMFRLTYRIFLQDVTREKEMIDALRIRNGNLEILCERADLHTTDL